MKVLLCLATLVFMVNCLHEILTRRTITPEDHHGSNIYHAKNATSKEAPHVVSILIHGRTFCGGAILNKNWILSNGECGYEIDPSQLTVLLGSSDGVKGKECGVKKIVLHPEFGKMPLDYDFSLFKLNCTIKFSKYIQPAKLPTHPPATNASLTISGFGATAEGGSSGHLMTGTMFWQSMDFCQKAYRLVAFLFTDRVGCAYNRGKTTPCGGDWGDALIENNTVHALFIASGKKGFCTPEARPGIFASLSPVAPWASEIISEN